MSAEGRQFVDTNVLVYLHDRSAEAKHRRARQLVGELWQSRSGCLSLQVLQELYVNVTRKVPKPLSLEPARQLIASLGPWTLHLPEMEDLIAASRIQERCNEVRPHWALVPTQGGDPVTPADVYCHRAQVKIPAWQEWARQAKAKLDALMDQDAQAA